MDIEEIKAGVDKIKEGIKILSKGPMEYYIAKLIECREELFKRCCPFGIGDKVELNQNLDIGKSSGWYHCRHFLTCGSKATVVDIDFYKGQFRMDVLFDNETWIDIHGKEHKTDNKHSFCINEKKLRRCK